MRIFAGHDGGSGCCYYRMKLPLEELARHGDYEVTFRSGGNEKGNTPITLSHMQGYDVIVGQRFNHYGGLPTWRQARGPFSRLVYEIDDNVFSVTPVNWKAYHVFAQPEIREAVVHMAEVSDLVTVTTERLASVMHDYTGNENIQVLPNFIPGWLTETPRKPRERPAVGWQGGASHGADMGLVVGPVRRFLKRFPEWDLQLNGTDYRKTFKAGKRAVFRKWIEVYQDDRGYYETLDFDIGLAPLTGTEFDLSKSCIKVLEYAARGIPSIASDCEVYRSFIRHGQNGFLVKYEHEWLKYMSELAGDDDLRARMGETAREDARAWTIEKNCSLWATAYESLFRSSAVS